MITQFLTKLKNFSLGSFFFHHKRSLDEDSDDDDDLDPFYTSPPLKRSRYFSDDLNQHDTLRSSRLLDRDIFSLNSKASIPPLSGMNTQKNTKESLLATKRSHLEVSKLGGAIRTTASSSYDKENTSAYSPKISIEPDIKYLGTSTNKPTPLPLTFLGRKLTTDLDEDVPLCPSLSSFKFIPSITSTVGRAPTSDLSITKRKPIKSSRSNGSKCLGFQSTRHTLHKGSSDIVRHAKKRSFLDVIPSCGIRRYMTPRESIRLEDKERYKQLLQQYTSCNMMNVSSFRRPSITSRTPTSTEVSLRKYPSADIASKAGAIILSHLDPVTTSKTRLRLEKGEVSLTPSLTLPYSPAARNASSPKQTSFQNIPVIDLEAETASGKTEDNDIMIVKEITPSKPARNSLEDKLQLSPFYNDYWLTDLQQYYKDKASEREEDLRLISETKKQCEESRRECQKNLMEKVTNRISQMDITFPVKVTELSELTEEEELPELTPEMENVIARAFKGGPPGQILAEKFNIQISRRDIHTLAGLNWLNDEVINFYMNMLMERGQNDNYPSVYAFNTFFYSKLIKMGYGSVRRWTKKVDIFSYDLLLVPVHLGMHWCLATVDFRSKCIRYYDSMLGDNHKCLEELKKYLESEQQDKKKSTFDISSLSTENVKDIPQQMNGSDCGMFSCKFAEYLSRNAPITFTQEHMPYFRRRMVYEIVTQRLL